jgi:hypothetical protein
MSDPNTPNQGVASLSQLQYSNPYRDDGETGYSIEEFHCIYLGNNRIYIAETQQEMRLYFDITKDMVIGHSFILQEKTKAGTMIIRTLTYNQ